ECWPAEGEAACARLRAPGTALHAHGVEMFLDHCFSQGALVGVMRIKGRPSYIGPPADVLDRNRRIPLFRRQFEQRLLQEPARSCNTAIDGSGSHGCILS